LKAWYHAGVWYAKKKNAIERLPGALRE
jgi:hypothetical protein